MASRGLRLGAAPG